MKRKILMVYPEIPTTYWSFKYALSFTNYKSLMPPLGLITIAAMLPDHYDIKLIDMNITPLDEKNIKEADLIFLSAMIIQKESFHKVIKKCNELNKPIAAGGPYPTTSYEQIKGVDYFVLNEGEITLPKFIFDYENGSPQSIYMDSTKPDLSKTPSPRFDLLDMGVYATMALQASRGCPFNCEFCDIIEMFGRQPRYKAPEQFLNEMNCLYNTGYKGPLFIVDDNFIGNKQKVKELLYNIVEWQKSHDYPFTLFTEASINLAQDDLLMDLMVDAGFNMVFIGIETPHAETLVKTQKQQNVKIDMQKSVEKIQKRGIEVMAGFILGFDNDPENIFNLQINFIQKAGIPLAMIGLMMVLPNTQLQRRLVKEGRFLGNSHGNNTHDLNLNFIPVMPKEILVNGYKHIISELYSPKKYFKRCLTLIKRLPRKKLISRPIGNGDIKSFTLSLLKQTFSFYGLSYLGLLIKTLIYNWWNFPASVNLAIKGYHFFKITDNIIKSDKFSTSLEYSLKALQSDLEALIEKGKIMNTWQIKKHTLKLKYRTIKKYNKLNIDLQEVLNNNLIEFELNCDNIISQMENRIKQNNEVVIDGISIYEYEY